MYLRITGKPTYVLGEVDLSFWTDVVARAAFVIDLPETEHAALEISAKAFGKALYTQYSASTDTVPNWELLSNTEQTAWEAVGRHLANFIDSDGQAPVFAELEDRIVDWAKSRVSVHQLVF